VGRTATTKLIGTVRPTCMFSDAIARSIWQVTARVFEIFFDTSRSRSNTLVKSMSPATSSW